MSVIDSKRREYKQLKDDIDKKIKKIATAYEDSKICFQDQRVIDIITEVIENEEYGVYGLLKKVGDAKEKSNIEGYTNTENALSVLKEHTIKDLSDKLDDLRNEISLKSTEAYDELSSLYATLKQDYDTACADLETNFENYDTYDDLYNDCCDKIVISIQMTVYVDDNLTRQRDAAEEKRDSAKKEIDTGLEKLRDKIQVELEQLLKDGLVLKKLIISDPNTTTYTGGSFQTTYYVD